MLKNVLFLLKNVDFLLKNVDFIIKTAAAFWNFDNSTDVSSPAYEASIYKMNDMLVKRGSHVCVSKHDGLCI